MNRVLLNFSDFILSSVTDWNQPGAIFRLQDLHRIDHLINVIRIQPGDSVRACLLNWGNAECEAIIVDLDRIELRLLKAVPRLNSPIGLVLGLCRPPSLRKVIEHATSMGVTHFFVVACALSEKSFLKSKWLRQQKLEELFSLGLAQDHFKSRQPQIQVFDKFKDFMQQAEHLIENFGIRMLLDQNASGWIEPSKSSPCFAIGPERGFTQSELHQLQDLDFISVKVSESVLRVEHACFHSLAQWEYCGSKVI